MYACSRLSICRCSTHGPTCVYVDLACFAERGREILMGRGLGKSFCAGMAGMFCGGSLVEFSHSGFSNPNMAVMVGMLVFFAWLYLRQEAGT